MKRLVTICFSFMMMYSSTAVSGDVAAGEAGYKQKNCFVCHGPGGKGMASYPKLSGKAVPYLVDRLETYRAGKKVGPNSSLMILNAAPLSDEEIANLAAYLSNVQTNK